MAKLLPRESLCWLKLPEIRLLYRSRGFSFAKRYKYMAAFDMIKRLLLCTYSTRLWTIFTKFITVPHVLLQRVTGITKWGDYYKVIKKVGFSLPSIFSQLTDSDRSLGYGVFAYRAELIFSPIRMKYSLFSPGPNVLDEVTLGSWSRIKMVFTTRSKLASLLFVLGLTAFFFCISYKAEIRKGNSKSRNNNRRIGKLMSWKWFTAFDARQVNYRLVMPSEFQ